MPPSGLLNSEGPWISVRLFLGEEAPTGVNAGRDLTRHSVATPISSNNALDPGKSMVSSIHNK